MFWDALARARAGAGYGGALPVGLRVLVTAKLMFLSMGVDIPCGMVAYPTVYRRVPGRRRWVSTGASPVDGKGPDVSANRTLVASSRRAMPCQALAGVQP